MANIKISELNELEQVDNDDLLVIVDTSANETKKVKARNVGTGGGGSDIVIISDTQPTSENNKIWIDTGEVQNLGSEVHIGNTINSKIGLNILFSKELFTTANLTDGYLNNDGTITTNQQFSVSDYINIYGANKLTISGNSGASEKICFYNSSKTFVSYVNTATNTTLTFDVPSNAYYIRVTVKNDNLDIYHLQKGTSIITPTINVYGEDIYSKPVVLYQSTGTQGTGDTSISLNDNVNNYKYLEIFYDRYGYQKSLKIRTDVIVGTDAPYFNVDMVMFASNVLRFYTSTYKITNNNSFTLVDRCYWNADSSAPTTTQDNNMRINKVIGYKE